MRLAHAPQHDLMRLGILLDPQRRVLGAEALQADRQLVLVGLRMRLNGYGQQGLRHCPRLEHQGPVLVDNESPVSARLSLPMAQMSPATADHPTPRCSPRGPAAVPGPLLRSLRPLLAEVVKTTSGPYRRQSSAWSGMSPTKA